MMMQILVLLLYEINRKVSEMYIAHSNLVVDSHHIVRFEFILETETGALEA